MENEDQHHIDLVKSGNTAHFSFLVEKYKHMAYTVALKMLNNPEDAEDVAQESFIKAYQQLHTFAGKSKFSTWLYTIVFRTTITKLKENKLEIISINSHTYENYTYDFMSPQFENLESIEEAKYVNAAIQKLPRMEALLITLYYINESSIKEIKEITGLSSTNIKVKLYRARKNSSSTCTLYYEANYKIKR